MLCNSLLVNLPISVPLRMNRRRIRFPFSLLPHSQLLRMRIVDFNAPRRLFDRLAVQKLTPVVRCDGLQRFEEVTACALPFSMDRSLTLRFVPHKHVKRLRRLPLHKCQDHRFRPLFLHDQINLTMILLGPLIYRCSCRTSSCRWSYRISSPPL